MVRIAPLLALLLAGPALAQDAAPGQSLPDHDLAEQAVTRGAILPLAEVLTIVASLHPGDVIEVELEEEDGVMVYELEIVTPEGRLLEIEVEAATGRVLDVETEQDDD